MKKKSETESLYLNFQKKTLVPIICGVVYKKVANRENRVNSCFVNKLGIK